MIQRFQQLKVLAVILYSYRVSSEQLQNETYNQNALKLESIFLSEYHSYVNEHRSTLKKLEIGRMDYEYLPNLLQNLKALKYLTVRCLNIQQHKSNDEELTLEQNDTIETLKVSNIYSSESSDDDESYIYGPFDDDEGDVVPVEYSQRLQNIILAFPSLKELVLYDNIINQEILQFLGKTSFIFLKSL